jgi:hypothetical protein
MVLCEGLARDYWMTGSDANFSRRRFIGGAGAAAAGLVGGWPTDTAALSPAANLPRKGGVVYMPPEASGKPYPRVLITQPGATLDSIDFSGCYVTLHAENAVFRKCRFTTYGAVGATVDGYEGADSATFEECHFDGERKNFGSQPLLRMRTGSMTVRSCLVENLPSDGITIVAGAVEHCVFRNAGYLDEAHSDAIWVPRTIGRVAIVDNDIDWRKVADAKVVPNNAIQCAPTTGDIFDVEILRNRCRGGTYTIQVAEHPSRLGKFKLGRVALRDNLISDWLYGPLYPLYKPADLVFSNNRHLVRGHVLTGAPVRER